MEAAIIIPQVASIMCKTSLVMWIILQGRSSADL
jgi:hypothetical protein